MNKKFLTRLLAVLAGNALYALAVTFFIVPSGLILGGFTGLSIAISHAVGIKVSYMVLFFHILAFIAGTAVLGKSFALSTAAGTVLYPFFLNISESLASGLTLPLIPGLPLNTVIAAAIIGIGLGVLTRNGTSTGGTEVIPLVINKLTGHSVGALLFMIDGAIMLVQLAYSDISKIIYGLVLAALYSYIVGIINNIPQKY